MLELLDWQLNVATEHDLVGHLVGSLQPTIAAEIRDSTTISTRTSLELDDGWTLSMPDRLRPVLASRRS